MKDILLLALCLCFYSVSAQTPEILEDTEKPDSVISNKVESDSLLKLSREPHVVHPSKLIKTSLVLDTLRTENRTISIVLYNDNTWRYIRNDNFQRDSTIYNQFWSNTEILPYRSVPLDSLPKQIDIEIVDSLGHYHYPYIGRITSRYGLRHYRNHNGIDMALKVGDPIYATFDGKVRFAKYTKSGYGNLVIIRHDNGLETYYGHMSKILVEDNQTVAAGQVIGLGGSTGRSTGPHIHFETRYFGQSFDPERIIDFQSGDLRRDIMILRRSHFSIFARYAQDFESEIEEEEAIKKAEAEARARKYYVVRNGDNLSKIAKRNHTTVAKICKLNNIKASKILQPGKRLRVR